MCLLDGSKPVNLGRVRDSPQWRDGVIVLKYTDGDPCPDKTRKKSATIRFTCSESQVVSGAASTMVWICGPARQESWHPGGAGGRARGHSGAGAGTATQEGVS